MKHIIVEKLHLTIKRKHMNNSLPVFKEKGGKQYIFFSWVAKAFLQLRFPIRMFHYHFMDEVFFNFVANSLLYHPCKHKIAKFGWILRIVTTLRKSSECLHITVKFCSFPAKLCCTRWSTTHISNKKPAIMEAGIWWSNIG